MKHARTKIRSAAAVARHQDVLPRVRSVISAAKFVSRVGIALVFPSDDLVLPTLWEAVTGTRRLKVFTLNAQGKRVFTPELERVWLWKNQLAEKRLACVGKHVRGRLTLISLDLLPVVYTLTGRRGRVDDFLDPGLLSPVQTKLAGVLLEAGPMTAPQLRFLLGFPDAPRVKRALEVLQRLLVVTQTGEAEQEHGWAAAVFDLLCRRYHDRLRRLPEPDDARKELAAVLLRSAGQLSAADAAAAFGFGRDQARATLDRLVEQGSARRFKENTVVLWAPARRDRANDRRSRSDS